MLLARTVRFAISPPDVGGRRRDQPGPNGFAASPPPRGLARHVEITVRCRGEADPVVGYLADIKDIDRAVHATVVPRITSACHDTPHADPAAVLAECVGPLATALPAALASIQWDLSPYHSIEMSPASTTVLVRQRFDFAAAHRLHVPTLSDAENRRLFGKCNNPSGHGHNYRIEPCVAVDATTHGTTGLTLDDLESLVQSTIIDRFDHKHLNNDTPEFASVGGVNPSVENIARVFFELLAPTIEARGARLHSMTVWETDRTSATYPG